MSTRLGKGGEIKQKWKVDIALAEYGGHKYTSLCSNKSENTGGWNRKRALVTAKYYRALVTVNNCVSTVQNINVKTIENVYEMLY